MGLVRPLGPMLEAFLGWVLIVGSTPRLDRYLNVAPALVARVKVPYVVWLEQVSPEFVAFFLPVASAVHLRTAVRPLSFSTMP